ncbi:MULTISPECIES: auxiliary protein of the heavy metal cation-transporting efflux system HmyCBA [unclassified Cupriavidus]|uniref:auxiliary protein of the heavy metal cation-transporting efflux system HmyCBA n=1 Tax=unclassified Cupriavidus TaxID=2640874 RepID=UPI001CEC402F|nr:MULTISPECIES: auxiliary protein of the heavy metal cation-transporting efflux system HmyCBA [unclassified Cupriavidus]
MLRFVLFLLTAMCLSALSFTAAANVRAAAPQVERAAQVAAVAAVAGDVANEADAPDYAMLATGDDLAQLVLPGDPDFGPDDEAVDDGPPPGYCNIWSADLLDPLDLFDAVDETSALFVLPNFELAQSVSDLFQAPAARTTFESEGLFRPPNLLA